MLGATLLAAAGPARAAPRERPQVQVRLVIDPCVEAEGAEVRRLFAIEFDAQLEGEPVPAGTARVGVACTASPAGGVELRVDDPITGKALARTIDLSAAPPNARPRLLALALAELLFTSWTELEVTPRPAVPPAGPPPPPQARQAARLLVRHRMPPALRPLAGVRLLGLAACQGFFSGAGVLWGGGLRVGGDHRYHLGWAADLLSHHGENGNTLGALSTDTLSIGAVLSLHREFRRLAVRAGAGVRAGATRLGGQPQDPQQAAGGALWGAFAGPLAALSATLALPHRLALELSLEGGYEAYPVGGRVAGKRVIAVEGPFLGLQLGIGMFP